MTLMQAVQRATVHLKLPMNHKPEKQGMQGSMFRIVVQPLETSPIVGQLGKDSTMLVT